MVSAWPEPPNAKSAATSAGVWHIVKAFAFSTTERLPNREERGPRKGRNEVGRKRLIRSAAELSPPPLDACLLRPC
jgi:hypothetical protein